MRLPRLRVGTSKGDPRAQEAQVSASNEDESPPPTPAPKSVRPALDVDIEAELRKSCAHVVDGHSSTADLLEQQNAARLPLDYDAIRKAMYQDVEPLEVPPLRPRRITRQRSRQIQQPDTGDAFIAVQSAPLPATSERYTYKPTAPAHELQSEAEDDFSRMRAHRSSIMQRAEQLMSNHKHETQKVLIGSEVLQRRVHSRTSSSPSAADITVVSPLSDTVVVLKSDLPRRPKLAGRSDSLMTTDSTPPTDTTESVRNGSTAPTTAAATPAQTSQRTSSQHPPPLRIDTSCGGVSRGHTTDVACIKRELERQRKVFHESQLEHEIPQQDAACVVMETAKTAASAKPRVASIVMPKRKPVPKEEPKRRDSTEEEIRQSRSRSRRADRATEPTYVVNISSQTAEGTREPSRPSSRARDIGRGIKEYFRPTDGGTIMQCTSSSNTAPQSRAASQTRWSRDHTSRASSRKASMEGTWQERRSASVESFRSAISVIASSMTSSTNATRPSSGHDRRRWWSGSGGSSVGISRSNSGESDPRPMHSRFQRGLARPQQQAAVEGPTKLNLNRQLPPLPGLDQWKPVEPATTTSTDEQFASGITTGCSTPDPVSAVIENYYAAGDPTMSSSVQARERLDLPVRKASPPQVPKTQPTGATPLHTLNNTPVAPRIVPVESSLGRHYITPRSKSIFADYTPEQLERLRQISLQPPRPRLQQISSDSATDQRRPPLPSSKSTSTVLAPASRSAFGFRIPLNLRSSSYPHQKSQSRSQHQPNPSSSFSPRQLSADNYTRMYDPNYTKMVEITSSRSPASPSANPASRQQAHRPTRPHPATASALPSPDQREHLASGDRKRHWWKSKKNLKQMEYPPSPDWMDAVVLSGSRSGMILTDDVAGAPIVRY